MSSQLTVPVTVPLDEPGTVSESVLRWSGGIDTDHSTVCGSVTAAQAWHKDIVLDDVEWWCE